MSYCSEFFRGIIEEVREPFSYSAYLLSDKAVYCDGFERVLKLSEGEVRLKIKGASLVIEGEELRIARLEEKSIVIEGKIGGYRIEKQDK